MKGKLPVTEKIILESNEDQWRLQVNDLVAELKTSGIIERELGEKVRIKLTIHKIVPPERMWWEEIVSLKTDSNQEFEESLRRSLEFLYGSLIKTAWLFYGYIDGEERIPVAIIHIQSINLSIYTQKLKTESMRMFFPESRLN